MLERLGRYRIDGVLGKGAMGTVYKAYDPLIARVVALKTIRKDLPDDYPQQQLASRFLHEARAAGRLSHPNIVAVHDYAEDGGIAFIAMEFADGVGLDQLLRQRLPCHLPKVLGWMRQLLLALHHAHCREVVHRDLKPANLIITAGGQLKLIDFGVARIDCALATHADSVIGTPCYMSPEQCRGEAVDGRSDLFSAGIVFYQLLTGERPFSGSTAKVTQQILTHPPRRPSDLDPSLDARFDRLISRALAKHPDERFASALEFLAVLQALADTPQDDELTRLCIGP
ncbi:serine/threonine-protein kinase [Pseudomonas sp. NPDC089401]|uniref:serine/threonine-protein kinase n=1 Tax=Pseudomonas sp. NPDC089401 TaxID=3364462 RepID=UPI00381729B6